MATGVFLRQNAEKLYNIHRFESGSTEMHLIFRDHTISDLIGFVYSGMPAQDAAHHLMHNIKRAAQPFWIKDETPWYRSSSTAKMPGNTTPGPGANSCAASTTPCSTTQASRRSRSPRRSPGNHDFGKLPSLVPGSWINANFNVWIGAPEDNRSWDYLYHARDFYAANAPRASEAQRQLAFEELLIAEGSDWNWWYGPEHHSANDREFDELYRKHLSNVYQALGATPPDYLAQPISGVETRPEFTPQTHYIHPRITGDMVRYFEWMGAAMYTADRRAGAMHGKQFLVDSVYAGIDETNAYGRLDFVGKPPEMDFDLVVNLESWAADSQRPRRALRLDMRVEAGKTSSWQVTSLEEEKPLATSGNPSEEVKVALLRNFEFTLPLAWLLAKPVASALGADGKVTAPVTTLLRLRFSLWQNRLPVDALPLEGWIELRLLSEEDLMAVAF